MLAAVGLRNLRNLCWIVGYVILQSRLTLYTYPAQYVTVWYPKCVRRVSIKYPNLWTKNPPLLYESLSNLKNFLRLCSLTLRFTVIENCTMDNLMCNIMDVLSSMKDDVVQQCTLYLHFDTLGGVGRTRGQACLGKIANCLSGYTGYDTATQSK